MPHDVHDHDRGLSLDLPTLLNRRGMLGLLAGAGLVTLVGCGDDDEPTGGATSSATSSASATASATATDASAADCDEVPGETAGPFPGDGSNGPNILAQSGVVRSDIRSSFGSAAGVAAGVPLTIAMTILDTSKSCAPMAGAAVYVWQCDREGNYSMYSEGAADENYLRGVQETDASGVVRFASIFPAAYQGRWPHIHFEVYPSLADAASASGRVATSQLALPEEACDAVYATDGYDQSVRNMTQTPLEDDFIFSDGYDQQMGTVTGDVSAGYTVALSVAV